MDLTGSNVIDLIHIVRVYTVIDQTARHPMEDKATHPEISLHSIPKRLLSSYKQLEIIGGIQLYHHLIMPVHEAGNLLVTHQQDWVTQLQIMNAKDP